MVHPSTCILMTIYNEVSALNILIRLIRARTIYYVRNKKSEMLPALFSFWKNGNSVLSRVFVLSFVLYCLTHIINTVYYFVHCQIISKKLLYLLYDKSIVAITVLLVSMYCHLLMYILFCTKLP